MESKGYLENKKMAKKSDFWNRTKTQLYQGEYGNQRMT